MYTVSTPAAIQVIELYSGNAFTIRCCKLFMGQVISSLPWKPLYGLIHTELSYDKLLTFFYYLLYVHILTQTHHKTAWYPNKD